MDWGVSLILDLENFGLRHLWKPFVDAVTEVSYLDLAFATIIIW